MKHVVYLLIIVEFFNYNQAACQAVNNKNNSAIKIDTVSKLTGQLNLPNEGSYTTFKVTYPAQKTGMLLFGDKKSPLKSIGNALAFLQSKGEKVLFVTNGGMYTQENLPKGLYIENGRLITRLDKLYNGAGNFYMQPNGIFVLFNNSAKIITTAEYPKYTDSIKYATQSGPMLVINGVINPNFKKNSANKNIRSGVGIDKTGRLVFAISNNPVTFYNFATLFQRFYKCTNALYLDGAISKMYCPAQKRFDSGGSFGVMIYITGAGKN